MKEFFEIIGGVLAFVVVIFVIQLFFEPAAAQREAISVINVLADIYHSAVAAFSK